MKKGALRITYTIAFFSYFVGAITLLMEGLYHGKFACFVTVFSIVQRSEYVRIGVLETGFELLCASECPQLHLLFETSLLLCSNVLYGSQLQY